jgi:hypothetical protein
MSFLDGRRYLTQPLTNKAATKSTCHTVCAIACERGADRPSGAERLRRIRSVMRLSDSFLKYAGFIAEVVHSDSAAYTLDYLATGFFVTIPSQTRPDKSKRIARDLEKWYAHDDPLIDVAIAPCTVDPELDITSISTKHFVTDELVRQKNFGIGDEVFIVGLFSFAPGQKQNQQIVRQGNIAMIPSDQIHIEVSQEENGFTDAYRKEARSTGGISGCPVFVQRSAHIEACDESGQARTFQGLSREFSLLGMAHGPGDIKESELNSPH